jgi:hypothetical protein
MNIDPVALRALWKADDIPACNEGMVLARQFMESCTLALETGNSANFSARFDSYRRHQNECGMCHDVSTLQFSNRHIDLSIQNQMPKYELT